MAVNIGDTFNPPAPLKEVDTVGSFISSILTNIYIIAGVIFLILLIVGGISVISSAGNSNPDQAAKGWRLVSAAGIGFLIIFSSYWIIQLVQFITGLQIL